jgi:hypothetical protein
VAGNNLLKRNRKSQLAIHFAHQIRSDNPKTSVFWVDCSSRAAFLESYRALADVLELPRRHEPHIDLMVLVRDWLQKEDVSPWLMVADNADKMDVMFIDKENDDETQVSLVTYLPKSTNGKILVTSRSLDVAKKLVGHSRAILKITTMDEAQALQLLKNRLENEADEASSLELVIELGYIPLAVSQAAAYINRRSPRVTTKSYLDELRKSEKRKDGLLRVDKGDLGQRHDVSNSVVLTWQVTFEQIKREQPSAVNLLCLMSRFQPQNIPEHVLRYYGDETVSDEPSDETGGRDISIDEMFGDRDNMSKEFEDDMDILRGYSLVTLTKQGFCEIHPLVQFCTRSWISEFGDPARWDRLFILLASIVFPHGQFETGVTCQTLLPHIQPVLGTIHSEENSLLSWAILNAKVSRYFSRVGEYSQAEVLAWQAFQTLQGILGHAHAGTMESMSDLATIFQHQGRWGGAGTLFRRLMELSEVLNTRIQRE